jgi:DeoR/GlpR family transcriptional regulator of sugar metabolism
MAVLLDDSTTSLALARHLNDIEPLTVVTNHLETLNVLGQRPGLHLVALGGDYDRKYNAFMGVACVETIEKMRVDIAFVSTYGLSGGYAYHQDQHMVSVKRAMLASGKRRVLLADHTKVGRVALHQVCALSSFDLVVVDDGTPASALHDLDEQNVTYEVGKAT